MITLLVRLLRKLRCQHYDSYRELRYEAAARMKTIHLVCPSCGHARPMIDRTPAERRKMKELLAKQREMKQKNVVQLESRRKKAQ